MKEMKEILKPPFSLRFSGGEMIIGDDVKEGIFEAVIQGTDRRLLDIAYFSVDALNEKWERDFGKPTE
jgi:hypothetical protein